MSNKELKELMSIICEGQDSEQRRKVENFIEYQVQLIDSLDKEIERLTAESTKWESKFYGEAKKVDRAIEYIEKNSYTTIETIDGIDYFIVRLDKCVDLLDILKGSGKE